MRTQAPQRAGRLDVHGRLQTVFRLGAGKILGVQHGARRQTHHGCDAGGSVRELPEEKLPGRLRRVLRGEHVLARPKTSERNLEGNCEPGEANSRLNQTSGYAGSAIRADTTGPACPSLSRKAKLQRANDVGERSRHAPPANEGETVRGIAEEERPDQDPDIDVPPRADAADEAIEV